MSSSTDFNTAVLTASMALGLKAITMVLLQVRARVLSITNYSTEFKEDEDNARLWNWVLYYPFLGFLEVGNNKEMVDIGDRINLNNAGKSNALVNK